jgi:hypothetical protein
MKNMPNVAYEQLIKCSKETAEKIKSLEYLEAREPFIYAVGSLAHPYAFKEFELGSILLIVTEDLGRNFSYKYAFTIRPFSWSAAFNSVSFEEFFDKAPEAVKEHLMYDFDVFTLGEKDG